MTSIKTETVKSKRASMKQTEQIRDKRAFLEGRRQEAFGATDSWFYAGVKASEDWQALTAHPAPAVADFSDAYHGAREDLAIWKKRALEAEELNRKFIADINGQTFMGEPASAVAQPPAEVVRELVEAAQKIVDRRRRIFDKSMHKFDTDMNGLEDALTKAKEHGL